jgi:hypothetical protein
MLGKRMYSDHSEDMKEKNNSDVQNQEDFESDTKKLVRRHLSDKDHVITDEEIASIRVGMIPPLENEEAAE